MKATLFWLVLAVGDGWALWYTMSRGSLLAIIPLIGFLTCLAMFVTAAGCWYYGLDSPHEES